MPNLNKLITPFLLYWHFSLDTVLTHVFVIGFIYAGFPATAAFLMSLDALFKILFSIFMSRLTLSIPSLIRGKVSFSLRILLVIVWYLSVSKLPIHNFSIYILIPYIIFKFILLFESFVSSEFIFGLKEYFSVDLSQSVAAQNILIRASTAIAPAIALTILSTSYASGIIFIVALLLCMLCIIYLKDIFISSPNSKVSMHSKPLKFKKLMDNPIMRWGLIYQVVGNLAFAGVSFILLKQLNPHGDLFLNEITMLYSAFLLVQILVLIFGENIVLINNTGQVALTMGICAIAVILAGFSHTESYRLVACFVIGLTYSFTLSAVQKVVTTKLRGTGYIEYTGWTQMTGRLASFASTMTLGVAISYGFKPSILLCICGIAGIAGSTLLAYPYRQKIPN